MCTAANSVLNRVGGRNAGVIVGVIGKVPREKKTIVIGRGRVGEG
jgi:hypothetical protein